jgi:hypothetical protein
MLFFRIQYWAPAAGDAMSLLLKGTPNPVEEEKSVINMI